MSIKVTPFLRETHDQIENFYLNIKQGFISGFNAGNQTSEGFEFAFTKGDFDRDGFAAQLGICVHECVPEIQSARQRHNRALPDQRRHSDSTTGTRRSAYRPSHRFAMRCEQRERRAML